jgi:hypothetical protein
MYSPEVECANHKAFLQQTFDHSQYHRIVVAATKYRVWVRNYGSSSGMSILNRIRKFRLEVVRMVYATIQWGVVSKRWDCETVRRLRHEDLRRALPGRVSTWRLCQSEKRALSIDEMAILQRLGVGCGGRAERWLGTA